ncbi:hypothetical protein ACFE04_030443 [Oxalis oulophora]
MEPELLVNGLEDSTQLSLLLFNDDEEELRQLMTDNNNNNASSSFTALLELPATQAIELLHSPSFPSDARAANFSGGDGSSSSVKKKKNLVKVEPFESTAPEDHRRSAKRKEREKKVKGASKKSKSEDAEKLPYVHVRARRGQATDSHSLAERARREKINARMKLLQDLVPGCNKIKASTLEVYDQKRYFLLQISGTSLVLDEIINHVQNLQRQVECLSMRLAAVNPRIDFDLDSILASEGESLVDSNYPGMAMPLRYPEVQVNCDREQYPLQWHFDALHQQPVWGREDSHHNFITQDNSILSYNSSANSASLHSNNQLKMELFNLLEAVGIQHFFRNGDEKVISTSFNLDTASFVRDVNTKQRQETRA